MLENQNDRVLIQLRLDTLSVDTGTLEVCIEPSNELLKLGPSEHQIYGRGKLEETVVAQSHQYLLLSCANFHPYQPLALFRKKPPMADKLGGGGKV